MDNKAMHASRRSAAIFNHSFLRRLRDRQRSPKNKNPVPEYADIYALGNERKPEAVVAFLDRFLPDRIESADEYEVPQFSRDPQVIYMRFTGGAKRVLNMRWYFSWLTAL